jgi:hypothetical protein
VTPQEKEALYDEKVAPELARLAKLCQANGLSFVAGVEWEPGEIGRTCAFEKDASEALRRANAALQGNFGVGMVAITSPAPQPDGGKP